MPNNSHRLAVQFVAGDIVQLTIRNISVADCGQKRPPANWKRENWHLLAKKTASPRKKVRHQRLVVHH